LAETLKAFGYRLETAPSGQRALRRTIPMTCLDRVKPPGQSVWIIATPPIDPADPAGRRPDGAARRTGGQRRVELQDAGSLGGAEGCTAFSGGCLAYRFWALL